MYLQFKFQVVFFKFAYSPTEIGGGESSSNIINQENEEISLPDLNSNLDDEIIVIQHQNYHFIPTNII